MKLYADDTKLPTKLYREIENIPDDTHVLQDLSKESYILDPNGEILKSVKNIKDLCFTISYNLSWSDHSQEVVKKANKVLGAIKRVLGSNSMNEFSLLYKLPPPRTAPNL